jgi:hypothetical protein
MGSTHSGTPSPSWAMIEDSIEEFLTMSCMEGGFGLPSPRRRDTGALSAPVKTAPWMENALATQATMTVPSRMAALQSNAGLPFEQRHTHQGGGGSKRKHVLDNPLPRARQHHGAASSSTGKLLWQSSRTCHHIMIWRSSQRILMLDFASTQAGPRKWLP